MNTKTMIKELNAVAEKHKNDFVPTFQTNISAMCRDIIPKLEQLAEYEAIGTVEECREAMERQRAKKPSKDKYNHDCCPNCGWVVYQDEWGGRYLPHCENCGQTISWESDTD